MTKNRMYLFSQNNTGGSFIINDKLTQRVWIESEGLLQAIEKAKALGVYFNGCETGEDCDCCGDRWYEPFSPENFPKDYGSLEFDNVEEYAQHLANLYGWQSYIYYQDGRKAIVSRKEAE